MLKWKRQWLDTHKMVTNYLEDEEMDAKELGAPFNWIMDLINTAAKQFKKEAEKEGEFCSGCHRPSLDCSRDPCRGVIEDRGEENKEENKMEGEFAGYPYYEGEEWGGGPEPYEPNPYDGTYSEE